MRLTTTEFHAELLWLGVTETQESGRVRRPRPVSWVESRTLCKSHKRSEREMKHDHVQENSVSS